MTWTMDLPAVAGWYWYEPSHWRAECVLVGDTEDGRPIWMQRIGTDLAERLPDLGVGRWAGPIPPPKEPT
jgi:hypothetical protein